MASLEGGRSMGKWRANKSACRSYAPKAGELGHGAAWWVPTTAACALGRTHRCLFHIQLARRTPDPVLPGGFVLGLPAGTKTVVSVSREEAGSWSERSPLQLQLFAQCRACPGCTHMLPGLRLESKELLMGNPHFALLETPPLQILEEKAVKWNGQNQVLQPRCPPNEPFLWHGD